MKALKPTWNELADHARRKGWRNVKIAVGARDRNQVVYGIPPGKTRLEFVPIEKK
jgi:hypothetical protein